MPDDTGSDSDGQPEGLRITFQSCFYFVFLLLELFLFGLLVVLPVLGEGVKQVVDDLGREDPHPEAVGHLLTLPLHLHVER